MSYALQPTDFERGARQPAELVGPKPKPKRRSAQTRANLRRLPDDQRAHRRDLVIRALARVEAPADLAREVGAYPGDVHRWMRDERPVPERFVSSLEALASPPAPRAKPPKAATRRSGVIWCAGCAQHRPESQMRDFDGQRWVTLERCKGCQSSARIANDRATTAAQHTRHCQ